MTRFLALFSFLTTVLAAATTIPGTNITRFGCDVGTHSAPPSFLSAISKLQASDALSSSPRTGSQLARLFARESTSTANGKTINIMTYFHIITKSSSTRSVTPKQMADQLGALNAAYSPYGITFTLLSITNTTNDLWAVTPNATVLSQLKSSLRKGSYSTLNLYFHSDLSLGTAGLIGTCTLPTTIPPSCPRDVYSFDGCDVALQTVPGGSMYGYNQGKTAVHEVGHWLGLLHVFEGYTCSTSPTSGGDYIGDTPVQSQSTDGCPVSKDSCPGLPGLDSVHNYMDYSTDACYEKFTTGQVQRIKSLWVQFRAGK